MHTTPAVPTTPTTPTTYKLRKLGAVYPAIVYATLAQLAAWPNAHTLPGNLRLTHAKVYYTTYASNSTKVRVRGYSKVSGNGTYARFVFTVYVYSNGTRASVFGKRTTYL